MSETFKDEKKWERDKRKKEKPVKKDRRKHKKFLGYQHLDVDAIEE